MEIRPMRRRDREPAASDGAARTELHGWLDARAWAIAEPPSVLFDLATARLIEAKVLLPGASVLARVVASARDRTATKVPHRPGHPQK